MVNERLKDAIRDAGLSIEQFAAVIQVDPKSVGRWVSGNTVPYPKHRRAITHALNLSEADLWLQQAGDRSDHDHDGQSHGTGNGGHDGGHDRLNGARRRDTPSAVSDHGVVGAWGYGDDPGAPDPVALIAASTGPVEILDSGAAIAISVELTDILRQHAEDGHRVRVLTDGTLPCWEPLLEHPQISLFLAELPAGFALIKTPGRMILAINLEQDPQPGDLPGPLLELTATGEGLFERLAEHFEQLWELTGETDTNRTDPDHSDEIDMIGETGQAQMPGGTAHGQRHPGPNAGGQPSGRRWPNQPK